MSWQFFSWQLAGLQLAGELDFQWNDYLKLAVFRGAVGRRVTYSIDTINFDPKRKQSCQL